MPNAPAPASATLMVLLMCASSRIEMADGGVRRGHVIEAVRDLGLRRRPRRPSRRARSATSPARCPRSRPRARTRCAAPAPAPSGSSIRRSRKRVVALLVDQPGARALQLVAHAAGAPDLHVRAARRSSRPPCGSPGRAGSSAGPTGTGYCTTLTANGITGHGHACGWPNISDSGTVRPWSTSILLTMVRSKSSWITDCAMCAASSGWPITVGHRPRAPAFVGRLELGGACRSRRSGSCPG